MRARGERDLRGTPKGLIAEQGVAGRDVVLGKESVTSIVESNGSVSFAVKVHARAKRNGITGNVGDAVKLSLTTPPIEGRANDACVEFFAKFLKVPRSSVTIASGLSSRNKTIRVAGVTGQYVRDRLQS